ncbi:MAG: hypothetical protein IT373_11365 [Polyangiaceae bacterium]|nr:hypothetical protein [Polyangiaceae bacterium]
MAPPPGWSFVVLAGLGVAACTDGQGEGRADRPSPSSPRAAPPVASSAAPAAPPTTSGPRPADGGVCRSPLGVDDVTFTDANATPSQAHYPEVYSYWLSVVRGPCPPTHVDITVTGHGLVGGVRAELRVVSPDELALLADPTPRDPSGAAWEPEVTRGELLGTVTLRAGRAVALVVPKQARPSRGLPVYHPDTPLAAVPPDGAP